MSDTFLEEVAALVPLESFRVVRARRYLVAGTERALVAERQGYIIVAGHAHEPIKILGDWHELRAIRIVIRCRPGDQMESLRTAVKEALRAAGAMTTEVRVESAHRLREGSPFTARPDCLALVQSYTLQRPGADRVASWLRVSLECAQRMVSPMARVCELCQEAISAELALCDGVPGYYCRRCRDRVLSQLARDVEEFSNAPVSEGATRATGVAAAITLGLGAGAAASQLLVGPFTFVRAMVWVLGMAFLGAGIARLVILGAGGASPYSIRVSLGSSLAGSVVANLSFYAFAAMAEAGLGSASGVMSAARSLAPPWWGIVTLLVGTWIARLGAHHALESVIPAPAATFESIGADGDA